MRHFYIVFALALLASAGYGFVAPASALPPPGHSLPAGALAAIESDYHAALDRLSGQLQRLSEALEQGASAPTIRELHLEARLRFKELEWLLAFNDPTAVTRYLNGAPLPKTEPKVPEIIVIEPRGLQTIDELVFEEVVDYPAALQLVTQLRADFSKAAALAKARRLEHRMVFEAARDGAIRVYTLGLTGFDTPGSAAALPESRRALAAIWSALSKYEGAPGFAPADFGALASAFATADASLAQGKFEDFDRLRFLRAALNPITGALPRVQRGMGVERSADDGGLPRATNPDAPYLYSADLLSAGYYAKLNDHPKADARKELGKVLFFDPILSNNLKMSCSTCHEPERAFTDGVAKSRSSTDGGTVLRNAPTLVGSVYAEKYFYDLRETFLERQIKHVVADHNEFNTDFVTIENRLRLSPEYSALFAEAYGDQPAYTLSKWSVSDALARYVASLTGWESEFDRYARGETNDYPAEALNGYNIFMGKGACGTCHFAPTFSGLVPPNYTESESEVLGVPETKVWEGATVDPDAGRVANGRPEDEAYFHRFGFKTPTVRNVAVTGPYMHNGVYDSLEEVMRFYNAGGGAGLGITIEHQTLPFDSLSLSEPEIADVIAFMRTLTDYESVAGRPAALPEFPGRPQWNNRSGASR